MTIPRSAAAHAKHTARLQWLRDQPGLLAQLPSLQQDMDPQQSAALELACRQMRLVKLFTDRANAREGIRRCVSEIRGEAIAPVGSF